MDCFDKPILTYPTGDLASHPATVADCIKRYNVHFNSDSDNNFEAFRTSSGPQQQPSCFKDQRGPLQDQIQPRVQHQKGLQRIQDGCRSLSMVFSPRKALKALQGISYTTLFLCFTWILITSTPAMGAPIQKLKPADSPQPIQVNGSSEILQELLHPIITSTPAMGAPIQKLKPADSPQPIQVNGSLEILQELLNPIIRPRKETNYTEIKEHFQEVQRNLTLSLAVIMLILALLMWIIYGALSAILPSDISGRLPEPKISKSSIFTLSKTNSSS